MREFGTHRLSYGRGFGAGWRRRGALLGLLAAGALAAGCAGAPKPVVTQVTLTLVGAADVNPDARGRASPLTVRVYALKAPAAFEASDFFSLFDKDTATLGAEMAQRQEVLLRPGQTHKLEMTLPADVTHLGIMAAYRDLDRARWREVRALQVGKPLVLDATFAAREIRLQQK